MKSNYTYQKINKALSLVVLVFVLITSFSFGQEDGKTLFRQNCGACHATTTQVLVGPGLEGINDRRSEEWLLKWIKDSQALVKSGDADAVKVFEAGNKVVMPPFSLSDEQIKTILAFVKAPPVVEPPKETTTTAPAVAVEKSAPLTEGTKWFIAIAFIVIVGFVFYIWMLKRKIHAMGHDAGTVPIRDQVSGWLQRNGSFVVVVVIAFILLLMKSCISQWM